MSKNASFFVEFLIGLALLVLGIVLSIISDRFFYYGLMIVGGIMIIRAFVRLIQNKSSKNEVKSETSTEEG